MVVTLASLYFFFFFLIVATRKFKSARVSGMIFPLASTVLDAEVFQHQAEGLGLGPQGGGGPRAGL